MLEILKSYLSKEEDYTIIYKNHVYIYNYISIDKFTDNYILLKMKNKSIHIEGNNLIITKLEKKELLIKGIIDKVENKYE